MTNSPPGLVWLRRDLRSQDNPALAAAAAHGSAIALYIKDDPGAGRAAGAASDWWLDKSLRALGDDLAARGIPLVLRQGPAAEVLDAVAAEAGAAGVYWNRAYDRPSIDRDKRIKADLRAGGVCCRSFNGALLNEPWQVATGSGGPYRVFTPYWRAARPLAEDAEPGPPLAPVGPLASAPASETLADWGLHPKTPDWSQGFSDWVPGEAGAWARLEAFLDGPVDAYARGRDFPGRPGVSRLSPHLHFGEISPRQVWSACRSAVAMGRASQGGVDAFLRELGWREFNHHLLFHFPDMAEASFNGRFDHFPWEDNPEGLAAWRAGATGYPIVDAGLRELWATGWMHNRVRMIAASFLIKDLMIDWRVGEAWFWDTLVDADAANNIAGWQWVAGCGADAAPFFRIFNPVLQGEKFDPDGAYVRRWVPELARLENAVIHQPWRADPDVLASAGVRLGETYPRPIVDHAEARDRALSAYKRLS